MTDLEISKALAWAIGWKATDMTINVETNLLLLPGWRAFDYRDWAVIGPIAERYDAFPNKLIYMSTQFAPGWAASTSTGPYVEADTPQKAIALAVIEESRK